MFGIGRESYPLVYRRVWDILDILDSFMRNVDILIFLRIIPAFARLHRDYPRVWNGNNTPRTGIS